MALPQLWGGLECSIVRVGDGPAPVDQFALTGHDARWEADLDAAAALGLRALRYPASWERIAPDGATAPDWRATDARLGRLRALGVAPVLGLVHHGSGPYRTSLLDPRFGEALAEHAAATAARYPWVRAWTPVNEPLTTARFAGLYGHWWPHRRDGRSALFMVANQCRAVLLAMRAIRRASANPDARLVQTEDLGRVFSTPAVADQAAHENARRWLSFDLLAGRVRPGHPFHWGFLDAGVPAAWLDDLATGEAVPDVIGVNHYLTSDRFLDDRLHLHAPETHGGNGRQAYADVSAYRAPPDRHAPGPEALGFAARLRETRARYPGVPLALTEVQNGCPDEVERVLWLLDAWEAARTLQAEGARVVAVTAWSLFGATDWCSLLTRRDGRYEPGAFDARESPPRPTLVAEALRGLARAGRFDHPALAGRARWWRIAAAADAAPAAAAEAIATGCDTGRRAAA